MIEDISIKGSRVGTTVKNQRFNPFRAPSLVEEESVSIVKNAAIIRNCNSFFFIMYSCDRSVINIYLK